MKTASRAIPTSKNSTPADPGHAAGSGARLFWPKPVTRVQLIALVALTLACAAGNLIRAACWTQASGFSWGPPIGLPTISLPAGPIDRYTKIELSAPVWRPLRIEVKARVRGGSGVMGVTLDGEDQPATTLSADWQTVRFFTARPAVKVGSLSMAVSPSAATPPADRALEIADATVTIVPALGPVLRYGGGGALFGLALWALFVWPGPARREEGIRQEVVQPWRAEALAGVRVGVAIFALLAVWALIRPPNQTPDEPHHFIRVTSILQGPWVAGADRVAFDPRFLNPMTWAMPPLARIAFHVDERLSRADVEGLKATTWSRVQETIAPGGSLYAAIVSYPPLYYASVFAIAQPIVSLTGVLPYQAFYVYRLVSALLTTAAWVAVYLLLRRTRETAPYAGAIIAVIVLNPMLAYMSSGVNADALSVPLIAFAVIAAWRTLSTGAQPWLAGVATLAALLTKPSGAQMAGAVIVSAAWCAWRGRATWRHAWLTGRAVAVAGLIAYALFYAWSPTHFYPEPGHENIGLAQYVTHVIGAIPDVWISFWGYLGWLEYRLPTPWYAALFALALLCAWWRWRDATGSQPRGLSTGLFTEYLAVYVALFLASMVVGGFLNLRVAGYMLQGRYFLPVAIGLAPLVMQDSRWRRWTLPVFVGALNGALMWETVWRYYEGDWSLFWLSLPLS